MEENLFGYLDVIKSKNRLAQNYDKINVMIQTNGTLTKKIKQLEKYNLLYLQIASDDDYHRSEGCDESKILKLESELPMKHNRVGAKDIMAVGKSSNLFPSYYKCPETCSNFENNLIFTMDWRGNISPCGKGFGFFKLEGNLIEEPLLEIVERNAKKQLIRKLLDGGISEVAKYKNISEEKINELKEKYGSGGLCCYLSHEKLVEEHKRLFD